MVDDKIYMTHDLRSIPDYPLPAGYEFRLFKSEADIESWAGIVTETREFTRKESALERFHSEFSPHLEKVKKRMLFITTKTGEPVGTATAWYGEKKGIEIGRMHWVSIIPAHQGKQLGRPLIVKAMQILSEYHDKAYLTTQAKSEKGIHLYERLGWKMN